MSNSSIKLKMGSIQQILITIVFSIFLQSTSALFDVSLGSPTDIERGIRVVRDAYSFTCTSKGRFLIDNTDCKEYYLCEAAGVAGKRLTCPGNSFFSQFLGVCSLQFRPSGDDCKVITIITTTTTPDPTTTTTPDPTTTTVTPEEFECPSKGRFLIGDTNCKDYYLCDQAGVSGKRLTCPGNSFFSQSLGVCSLQFRPSGDDDCKVTPTPTLPTPPTPTFVCPKRGMYLKPFTDCREYYLCLDSGLEPIDAVCPAPLLFKPLESTCTLDRDYTCANITSDVCTAGFRCVHTSQFQTCTMNDDPNHDETPQDCFPGLYCDIKCESMCRGENNDC